MKGLNEGLNLRITNNISNIDSSGVRDSGAIDHGTMELGLLRQLGAVLVI